MLTNKNISDVIRENKTLLIIIAIVLFLIELEIFAIAAMKAGRKSWLQVLDDKNNIIHETDGKNLSGFNKYYFEKTFGPFEQYKVKLITKEYPFPFRAWFAAAAGIPVGMILLFAFVVKAYMSLFYGEKHKNDSIKTEYDTRLEKIVKRISRFNIFTIGFLVFLAIFSYWVIPNLITYLGRVGLQTLIRYKWVFISLTVPTAGFIIWVTYLRYILSKKIIENQMDVEKYRLRLEYEKNSTIPLLLEHDNEEKLKNSRIVWNNKSDDYRHSHK
ncbi:MAG: hypothetical protein JJV92_08965 [Desulfosarcina sp.]|nr:hypothetical protein [Desulfobacterales bacterium]